MTSNAASPLPPTIALPWHGRETPHAVLDILRGCNIICPDCYNACKPAIKSIEQIEREFNQLTALRRLQTITISGGEPLLHPDLPAIIRMIRRKSIRVGILTNGLMLDTDYAAKLRRAGADIVLLHIQQNQVRSDAPRPASVTSWRSLRGRKAGIVAAAGMTAGLAYVVARTSMPDFLETVEEMLNSPRLEFMLVTAHTDFGVFSGARGDVQNGLHAAKPTGRAERSDAPTASEIRTALSLKGLYPFAHVGSSSNPYHPRWYTYLTATLRGRREQRRLSVVAGHSDRFFMKVAHQLTGRRTFFFRAGRIRFRLQLLCNALSGGTRPREALPFLSASLCPGWRLGEKHIVFQEGPSLLEDGRVEICRDCPDATIVNNHLVPLCLADRMEDIPWLPRNDC